MVLPPPGTRLSLSPVFTPPLLKGIKVFRNDPFRFDFILDKGDAGRGVETRNGVETQNFASLRRDSTRLIKYFLAALTVPEKDLWVNLSPYEKDRIVPEAFGQTEMGRDLLAQDYILKQITASVIYPDEKTGKAFWAKVYAEAQKRYGTTDIPVDTFNKVWIVPAKATVYEHQDAAFVTESRLKVMLESDYVAQNAGVETQNLASGQETQNFASLHHEAAAQQELVKNILRDVIIPILEKEVNEGQNFATLRQVYHSLILATWYKRKIKASIMAQAYVDQKKISGIGYALPTRGHVAPFANVSPRPLPSELVLNAKAPQVSTDLQANLSPEQIWTRYVEAFKKGAYNLIKEEYDPATQETIPRKYFSGGTDLSMEVFKVTDAAMPPQEDPAHDLVIRVSSSAISPPDAKELATNRGFTGGERAYWMRYPEQMVSYLSQKYPDGPVLIADIGFASGSITEWTAQQNPQFRVLGIEREGDLVVKATAHAKTAGFKILERPLIDGQEAFLKPIKDFGYGRQLVIDMKSSDHPVMYYQKADITQGIKIPRESFDGIILHKIRDGIVNLEDREKLSAELSSLMAVGGVVSLVEDLYVEPSDADGAWFSKRYALNAIVIPKLMALGIVPEQYKPFVLDPNYHLILSLRDKQGQEINELIFSGREDDLVRAIQQGEILIRGVGIHETREHVIESFARHDFEVVEQWDIPIPYEGVKAGHLSLMKGLLLRKKKHKEPFPDGSDFFKEYYDPYLTIFQALKVTAGTNVVNVGVVNNYFPALAVARLGGNYIGFDLHKFNVKFTNAVVSDYAWEEYGGSIEHRLGLFQIDSFVSRDIPWHSQDIVLMLSGALSDPIPESSRVGTFLEGLRVIKDGGYLVVGTVGHPPWEEPELQDTIAQGLHQATGEGLVDVTENFSSEELTGAFFKATHAGFMHIYQVRHGPARSEPYLDSPAFVSSVMHNKIGDEFSRQFDILPHSEIVTIGPGYYNASEIAFSRQGHHVTVVDPYGDWLRTSPLPLVLDPMNMSGANPFKDAIRVAGGSYTVVRHLLDHQMEGIPERIDVAILADVPGVLQSTRLAADVARRVRDGGYLVIQTSTDPESVPRIVRELRKRGISVYKTDFFKPYMDRGLARVTWDNVGKTPHAGWWSATSRTFVFKLKKNDIGITDKNALVVSMGKANVGNDASEKSPVLEIFSQTVAQQVQRMPVWELLGALDLEKAGKVSTRQGSNGLVIQRVRVPKLVNKGRAPQGLEILPQEMVNILKSADEIFVNDLPVDSHRMFKEMDLFFTSSLLSNHDPENSGGIDLNPAQLDIKTQNPGGEIAFNLEPTMLARLQKASGISPVIVSVRPLENLSAFMGIQKPGVR